MGTNIGKKVTFTANMWARIEKDSAELCVTPQQWLVTAAMQRFEGPMVSSVRSDTVKSTSVTEVHATDQGVEDDVPRNGVGIPLDELLDPDVPMDRISPHVTGLKEIRQWQEKLKWAEDEYDGYKHGVAEGDWELEQTSDYVIDCRRRADEARAKLKELLPPMEEKCPI